MLNYAARRIFGTRNDRILKSLKPLVIAVNDLEKKIKPLSDDQLRKQTELFKERCAKGESLDSILPEAFAVVREGSKRALGMRHFDVQLIGGMVLHSGKISEMKTGEGKTLVATLPAYLNAITGKGVHIVTVNDYLARRDAEWMGRLYHFLGLSVGCVLHGLNEEQKKAAYQSDITYGQNNEFGFDYLRDNMKVSAQDQFQRGHHYAIVDEVDSILIDEARTPLIISGPAEESTELYSKINKIVPSLKKDEHFEIDLRSKTPTLNDLGVAKTEQLLGIENLFDPNNIETLHHVNQALRAHSMMERDVDYVVKDGQIIIVDEFTGRLMPGRRWSNGLHQAIEAKEGVKIARENQTLASITFQNYFRQYEKLSGMTGTADTEAAEFQSIYKLETVVIPTNQIMIRADESDQVFRNKKDKYEAVVEEIKKANETGQPILAGTISIDQSERLSAMLKERGVAHNVLNAKHHEREAEIVAQAGRYKAVTIATNMAGRGTDIVLGGNPEFLAAAEAGTKDPNEPAFQEALKKYTRVCAEEREKVVAAGGLYIIGTERHESRRIDNQLRGRAGRQGDPGRSRFYISLEDDLMLRFGGEKMKLLMARFGWEEGLAIDGRLISRSIESAQKKVEAFHFEMRKHVTEYDDVMNKQRQVIYNLRTKILMQEAIREEIEDMVVDAVEDAVLTYCDERAKPVSWDLDKLKERFQFLFNAPLKLPSDLALDQQLIFDEVKEIALKLYERHVAVQGEKLSSLKTRFGDAGELVLGMSAGEERAFNFEFAALERNFFFETLDHFWNRHLQAMDELREGIGLRGWGQKNPLHEYQREGFLMFQQMIAEMKETIVRKIFFFDSSEFEEVLKHFEEEMRRREEVMKQMQMVHESTLEPGAAEGSSQEPQVVKGPDDQRARLEAQRRERRKQRR